MSICIHGHDTKDGCDTCREMEKDHDDGNIFQESLGRSSFRRRPFEQLAPFEYNGIATIITHLEVRRIHGQAPDPVLLEKYARIFLAYLKACNAGRLVPPMSWHEFAKIPANGGPL